MSMKMSLNSVGLHRREPDIFLVWFSFIVKEWAKKSIEHLCTKIRTTTKLMESNIPPRWDWNPLSSGLETDAMTIQPRTTCNVHFTLGLLLAQLLYSNVCLFTFSTDEWLRNHLRDPLVWKQCGPMFHEKSPNGRRNRPNGSPTCMYVAKFSTWFSSKMYSPKHFFQI
jgi:hypothetical protein